MTASVGVVAHHSRQAMAEQLSAQINADFVSFDQGDWGPNCNARTVWLELADTDTEWAVCVEDDAAPVIDFRHQLDMALAACPTNVCSLYLGKLRPPQYQQAIHDAVEKAQVNDACFILANQLYHAVGVAMKTRLVPDMLKHLISVNYLPIDEGIGNFCRHNGQTIAYTAPSLVDHKDVRTIIQHRDGVPRTAGRVAWHIGSRRTWDSTSVTL